MRQLGTAITLGLMLVSTGASAQAITDLQISAATVAFPFNSPDFGPTLTGTPFSAGFFGRSEFTSFVSAPSGGPVSFDNLDISSGRNIGTFSNTTVSFTFTNNGDNSVDFQSLITPAGLGFYMADVNPGCALSACSKVTGSANLLGAQGFVPLLPIGLVGFDFSIQDNGQDLFRVSGVSSIVRFNGQTQFADHFFNEGALLNFGAAYGSVDASGHGYHWDATPVSFDLVSGIHNLTYSTSVFSITNARPPSSFASCQASLVAYSGFGDPIGRGGGADAAFADFSAFSLNSSSDTSCPHEAPSGRGTGLVGGGPTTFEKPVFRNGVLTFNTAGAAVPEPATWAMLILGFGAIGAVVRRRRALAGALA